MASRKYYRDSRGQFAGSAGAAQVTYGKAGGFANAAHQSRVSAGRGIGRGPNPSGPPVKRSGFRQAGRDVGRQVRSEARQAGRAVGRAANSRAGRSIAASAVIAAAIARPNSRLGGGALAVAAGLQGARRLASL